MNRSLAAAGSRTLKHAEHQVEWEATHSSHLDDDELLILPLVIADEEVRVVQCVAERVELVEVIFAGQTIVDLVGHSHRPPPKQRAQFYDNNKGAGHCVLSVEPLHESSDFSFRLDV
eukprot:SAG11_NODE_13785_length_639_cov_2.392593_2_plen_116_part_01